MVDAPVAAEPESFGTWLRRQREVREIDLREIADSTKVSMSYLRAFEDDRFDVLPASVFAKGFLRQYARYVGLDPEEAVNFYLAAREPLSDEDPPPARRQAKTSTRKYLLLVLVATAALILLVWLLSDRGERPAPSSPGAASSEPRDTSPELRDVPSMAAELLPGETERSVPAQETAPPGAAAQEAGPREAEPREAGPGQAEQLVSPLRVTLDFLNDCWVEASVDGTERLSELKVQGESLVLDAEELVEIKFGDASAVEVEVNGVPFALDRRPGTSVRSVVIDLETAAAITGAVPGENAEG